MEKQMAAYTLENGEELSKKYPSHFTIPPRKEREALSPGKIVNMIFDNGLCGERIWVTVKSRTASGYLGVLNNKPVLGNLQAGDEIHFGPEHIIHIEQAETKSSAI